MACDKSTLFIGIVIGMGIAGIAGVILGYINTARNAMLRPDQPMTVPTKGTPREVMRAAAAGFIQFLIWSIVLVLFVVLMISVLYLLFFS